MIVRVGSSQCNVLFCEDKGDVAFVTYEKGEAEAKVRFKTENFAKPIAEKWSEAEDIKEHKVECKLLEVRFWTAEQKIILLDEMSSLLAGSKTVSALANQT